MPALPLHAPLRFAFWLMCFACLVTFVIFDTSNLCLGGPFAATLLYPAGSVSAHRI
jgi:hypothetical protein